MSDELSDGTKARKDLLLGLYADLRAHARHAETLRSNVVNYMIVLAGALIAVIASDANVNGKDLVLGVVVIFIGLLGMAFATTYTELYARNWRRAMTVRAALDEEYFAGGAVTMTELIDDSDQRHEAGRLYRWSRRLTGTAHRFWFALPTLILIAGVVVTVIAL
ncbi:hypothetical protein SK854_23045 [Lentzea sp. BCCO 10_0061]|uniref:SMODS and SLOG-associating 2TM effector domain-containing protein n=1 Tax=Lentzea sokolovensis TaxID=3095429 RepID=A0ABU4V0I7_9PSEU|nr:hypothetical protein [Lentzea sp. BCCO 10_0061]MDX8145005.1 hypothetical protein [Lentzea sp. BCCO 10_0061]